MAESRAGTESGSARRASGTRKGRTAVRAKLTGGVLAALGATDGVLRHENLIIVRLRMYTGIRSGKVDGWLVVEPSSGQRLERRLAAQAAPTQGTEHKALNLGYDGA